jgi:hypothetical protein
MRRGAGRQVDYILASQRFVLYNRPRALPCCHACYAAARLVALTNHNTGIGERNPETIGSRPWHFGKAATPLVDAAKPNLFNLWVPIPAGRALWHAPDCRGTHEEAHFHGTSIHNAHPPLTCRNDRMYVLHHGTFFCPSDKSMASPEPSWKNCNG